MSPDPDDPLRRLQSLVRRLRGPDGCPWDRSQTLDDLRAYLLEEAHEVAAAIDGGQPAELGEELGDLLFLVVFAAELAAERGGREIAELAAAAETKMVARHPHVFGDAAAGNAAQVRELWGRNKLAERAPEESLLDGVPTTLPALVAAYRMGQKAADAGFDWPRVEGVLDKLDEEAGELREALGEAAEDRRQRLRHELGDLLLTAASLARRLEIDPEAALAAANRRFRDRFNAVEGELRRSGRSPADASPAELDELWEAAKRR